MLHTAVCDLLRIAHPIIQAPFGPWSSVELAAAVSNAGGLGSLGAALRSPDQVREDIALLRALSVRPFAVNHTMRPFNEAAFAATIAARPPIISAAQGDPGDLVERAHDAGILFIQQVHTPQQAEQAAARGVDAIIAQGVEAGGFGGGISTLTLVPQVVTAVSPLPVIAAGGIADGRGLAAILALGAQGANIGTRFLAAREASTVPESWKRAILAARSEDAIKVLFADDVFPPAAPGGYPSQPRALRTPFVEQWNADLDGAHREAERLSGELLDAIRQGRGHELMPFTGQSAGLIHDILPAAEIIRTLVNEAAATLQRTAALTV